MSSGLKGAFFLRARFKLTLFYTAIQLVLVIGLCALLHYRNRRSMHKQLEMFLKHEAHAVLDFIRQSPDEESAISRHAISSSRPPALALPFSSRSRSPSARIACQRGSVDAGQAPRSGDVDPARVPVRGGPGPDRART